MPASPTLKTGARPWNATAGNLGVISALKPLNYGDRIWRYQSDGYPTASVVMKIGRRPSISPSFSNFTQDDVPHWAKTDVAFAATETNLAAEFVNHASRFGANDTWMNVRTREVILIGDSNGSADLTACVRGFGNMPDAASVIGDRWVKGMTAFPEGSTAPEAVTSLEEEHEFFAAEHSTTAELTDRLAATRMLIDPDIRAKGIRDARDRHAREWKRSFFMGGMGKIQTASGEQTGVMGVIDHCQTHTVAINGGLTFADLKSFVSEGPGPWSPDNVLVLSCSQRVANIVSDWGLENLQMQADRLTKQWGVDIDTLLLAGGRKIALMVESWLDEDETTAGWAFVLPVKMSKWRPVIGNGINGDTQLRRDIKTENSYKGKKDEWFTFGGWEHGPERAYGFMTGITH